MLSLLLVSAKSYRLCPKATPVCDDLSYSKDLKAGRWHYFYVKLNYTQILFFMNITSTGNASFFIGHGNHCPYRNDKPFVEVSNAQNEYHRVWKFMAQEIPIGVYSQTDTHITVLVDPVDFSIDFWSHIYWPLIYLIGIYSAYCIIKNAYSKFRPSENGIFELYYLWKNRNEGKKEKKH